MESMFIKAGDLAAALGLELSTFKKMVYAGELPQAVPVGKKLRRWLRRDIEGMAYMIEMKSRCKASTIDEIEADSDDIETPKQPPKAKS